MAYSWSMNMLRYGNLIMYYSNLHPLYLLIIDFLTIDPLTATVMALYRKMLNFI
jgi:hypothetical protein